MVFHRYIASGKLAIRSNGRPVQAWDPFLESRPDTWRSGRDRFSVNGYEIAVEGFVLPHKDRLPEKTWADAAGPDGWTSQQGFYVNRNERLLVAGHWRSEEHTSELQSLMRISYAVFCLKKKKNNHRHEYNVKT